MRTVETIAPDLAPTIGSQGILSKRNLVKLERRVSFTAARDGEPILEGERHDFLVRQASRLRRQGATIQDIEGELLALNPSCCSPPVEDEEVGRIQSRLRLFSSIFRQQIVSMA